MCLSLSPDYSCGTASSFPSFPTACLPYTVLTPSFVLRGPLLCLTSFRWTGHPSQAARWPFLHRAQRFQTLGTHPDVHAHSHTHSHTHTHAHAYTHNHSLSHTHTHTHTQVFGGGTQNGLTNDLHFFDTVPAPRVFVLLFLRINRVLRSRAKVLGSLF